MKKKEINKLQEKLNKRMKIKNKTAKKTSDFVHGFKEHKLRKL